MDRETLKEAMTHHLFEADELFDTLGLSGQERSFDVIDYMHAAEKLTKFISDPDEQNAAEKMLFKHFRAIEADGYTYGEIASEMSGLTVGALLHAKSTQIKYDQMEHLIKRSIHNITISQYTKEQGVVALFHIGFVASGFMLENEQGCAVNITHKQARDHIASVASKPVHSLEQPSLMAQSIYHVMRRLASIAMINGAKIQPPPHQTDEYGGWDPTLNEEE